MTSAKLIRRIEALEREVAEVKRKIGTPETGSNAGKGHDWSKFVGIFANDPYFERAVKAGAAYRRSLRPRAPGKKGGRK